MTVQVIVQEEVIALDSIVKDLTTSECGAVLVFHGVVRDHADGKAVKAIEYTCYAGMAEKELSDVVNRCLEAHPVSHVAVVHRTGRLAVGEASLGVVVASAHRREAFECGLMIIDEMKKTVPVWKKEFGPDGSHWV